MTRGARGRANVSGVRGREVVDGPRSREVLEGGRSRQVLLGPRGRNTGGLPAALREATLFLDAKYSVTGEPRVVNQGTGGSALDAKYGSVLGAYVYDGAAVLPGIVGNYLSTPDAAALDITGDIELVARLRPTNGWSDGVQCKIINKFTSPGQTSYALSKKTTGALELLVSQDGTTAEYPFSSASIAGTSAQWVKATYRASDGRVQFFYAADQTIEPTSWTQLGADRSTTYSSLFASTAPVEIGARQSVAEPAAASIYRTIVRDGIDGTTVLDVDLANVADYATSFTATTGQTVTVNSTSSDTNDPLLLTHTGENYVFTPLANNAQSLTVPSEADLQLNGPMTFYLEFTGTHDETDLLTFGLAKANAGGTRCYDFYMSRGIFRYTTDGSTMSSITLSSFARTFLTGVRYSIEWRVDPTTGDWSYWENGALVESGSVAPWTNFESTELFSLFGRNNSGNYGANWHRCVVTKNGTTVLDVNAATDITDAGATSFTASSGQTVTVNRATSGRKTALVTRPVWLFGTDDFLEVADNDLLDFGDGQQFTLMAVHRQFNTFAVSGRLIDKRGGTATGYELRNGFGSPGNARLGIGDGTDTPSAAISGLITAGDLNTLIGVRGPTNLTLYNNDVAGTPADATAVNDMSNSLAFHVGTTSPSTGSPLEGEVTAVAVWRRALDADEIAAINTYYGTA